MISRAGGSSTAIRTSVPAAAGIAQGERRRTRLAGPPLSHAQPGIPGWLIDIVRPALLEFGPDLHSKGCIGALPPHTRRAERSRR
jgi:hypothetical protein